MCAEASPEFWLHIFVSANREKPTPASMFEVAVFGLFLVARRVDEISCADQANLDHLAA
jgi:hypothetical protein